MLYARQDIIGLIAEQLLEALPVWLGQEVEELRLLSFSLRYTQGLADGHRHILRLKMPRTPDIFTLKEAAKNPALSQYSLHEYNQLQAMYAVVEKQRNCQLCAVPVVGCLPDHVAIVMIELPANNLETCLYYDRIGEMHNQPFDGPKIERRVRQCIQNSQHSDFPFKNILMTDDNCVAILDMDIVRLIIDMMIQKVKIRTFGFLMPTAFLERCESIFLQGYFATKDLINASLRCGYTRWCKGICSIAPCGF